MSHKKKWRMEDFSAEKNTCNSLCLLRARGKNPSFLQSEREGEMCCVSCGSVMCCEEVLMFVHYVICYEILSVCLGAEKSFYDKYKYWLASAHSYSDWVQRTGKVSSVCATNECGICCFCVCPHNYTES